MRLYSFSVTNFRSITSAHKVPVAGTTVLLGKNNEGKTNLLRALELAMGLLTDHALGRDRDSRYRLSGFRSRYEWTRDFPIWLQGREAGTQTIFRLDFQLDQDEIDQFKTAIGSSFNGDLPLEIRVGKTNSAKITLKKSGKNTKSLSTKSDKIARFVAERIYFNYIPAVRTDKEANEVVRRMLSHELRDLESNPEYVDALGVIEKLQKPVLDDLANRIRQPLSTFLPAVTNVTIEIPEHSRRTGLRHNFDVIIDDGAATSLEYKGDGVKSLAALALLRNKLTRRGASIIAIEEPESHLHPGAIHQLKEIISSLEDDNQVILSTHNPLFVNRHNIRSNIIVDSGNAAAAKRIERIRDILGVQTSDNLSSAAYALVVEGAGDVRSLHAILPTLSSKISEAIRTNILVLEPIGGAGNLAYKLSLLQKMLCVTHTLLDNDDSGRSAFKKAEQNGLVSIKSCTVVSCLGMPESEFEDCLSLGCYKDKVLDVFGVNLDSPRFRGHRKQWSERLKETFISQGKPWSAGALAKVKDTVAACVVAQPTSCLDAHRRGPVDALVVAVESMLAT